MITLYGIAHSRATRTIWALEELGLAWRHVPVIQAPRLRRMGRDPLAADAALNTLSPDFLRLSPAGAIPVIDDDGFVLGESLAINLYLAGKAGGPLAPKDPAEHARMTEASFYAATWIEDAALVIDKNAEAASPDTAAVAAAEAKLARPLDVLEGRLATEGGLVGGRFTIADVGVAEILRYAQPATALFDARPHLKAWLAACQARPAFRKMWALREAEVI